MTTSVPVQRQESGRSRSRRLLPVVGVGAGTALLVWALHVRDPHTPGSWGFCPTALMGFACPGCGSLRAVHHLTDLDVAAAASSNLLLVVLAPVAVLLWGRAVFLAWRSSPRPWAVRLPARAWWLMAVPVLVFTVLRNTPWGAGLAP